MLPPSRPSSEHSPSQDQPLFGLAGNTAASTAILICCSTHPGCGEAVPSEPSANEGEIDVTLPRCRVRHLGAERLKSRRLSIEFDPTMPRFHMSLQWNILWNAA